MNKAKNKLLPTPPSQPLTTTTSVMATSSDLRIKEIRALAMSIYQSAEHCYISRENFEMRRWATAVVDYLEQIENDQSRTNSPTLPSFACIVNESSSPPPSPIALSPTTSPRVSSTNLQQAAKETIPHIDIGSDGSVKCFSYHPYFNRVSSRASDGHTYDASQYSKRTYTKEIINDDNHPSLKHAKFTHYSPLPSLNSSRTSPSQAPFFSQFTSYSYTHSSTNTPARGISYQSQPSLHDNNVPRSSKAPSGGSIVNTQLIPPPVCEMPAFKKRGRPATRMDNQCVDCGTQKTPEWRRGEGGVHLCNACGLQYSKRVRKEKLEKERNAITTILNHDQ